MSLEKKDSPLELHGITSGPHSLWLVRWSNLVWFKKVRFRCQIHLVRLFQVKTSQDGLSSFDMRKTFEGKE